MMPTSHCYPNHSPPHPPPAVAEIIEQTNNTMEYYTNQSDYRFNPENPEKPKGADFANMQKELVNDCFNHWSKQGKQALIKYWVQLMRFKGD